MCTITTKHQPSQSVVEMHDTLNPVCELVQRSVLWWCLTAEQAVQRAESLTQSFDMFGGAEPAGDGVTEEAVIFTHRLEEEDKMLHLLSWTHVIFPKHSTSTKVKFQKFSHVHKLQTFFMKSLSGTIVSSSGAGLATDTRKTLMPDSLASVAACSRSSDGQPSISTIMTRGWARLAPFSWVKKVSTVCMMALPA